jgi:tRNA A-37 threonylcarbamoyl transferase component Bud32
MGAASGGVTREDSGMAGWSVPGVVHLRQVREDPVGRRVVARHRITRKPFAITYLSPEFLADAEFRARFASECAQLTQVRQAEVARVYRYLDGDDGAAVIGEHLNGTTLRSLLLAQGAIGTEAALVVLKGLLRALSACHQAGLAHGDVTPDDVILTPAGRVRLTGFGLWTADGRQQLSRYTPYYLAPEQWSGPAVSRASGDVYAATVTFFECLVGAPPFYAHDAVQLSAKHRASLVPVEVIPEAVRELVVAGLAKDPGSRPDASSLLAAAGEVATREAGRDWERRGRRELAAHLAPRSALMDVATLSRRIRGAGRMGYRPVRLAAVMGGALALAAGLSSPPLAVIPGINIFGPGGRPPVLAFPEPDRGPVAMRVVTNGRPADRAQTPAAKVSTAGPVVGTRPSASSMEEATARADHAHLEALPQRAAQPQGVIADSTSARFTRACTGHLGDGSNPCTAQQVQPTPGSAGSPSDPSEVSIPVALPVPLLSDIQPVQLPLPVQLPVPVQQPAPVQDVRPSSVPDEAGARKDFHTAKDFSSHMDSQVPRKMTVRAKRADTDSARFGPPRTLSQNGFGSERGFGGSSGAGRMGNR